MEDLILKVVKDRQEESLKDGKNSKDLLQMILESADADNELHQYIRTTTRGAEILSMVSSQLKDKQQEHEKFLQFLALSKRH